MSNSAEAATSTNTDAPTLAQAIVVWARIGVLSFGGPAAQIALMHRIIVEEHRWLNEKQYLNALSFCMLLPGPEAMQLATYAGWRLHGVVGGLAAGLLFVLPGALVVLVLAAIYAIFGDVSWITSLFFGIKAAVIVIVFEALLRVAKRALGKTAHWIIAALSFVGIFFLELPYPLIIVLAALFGFSQGKPAEQSAETLSSPGSMLSRTVLTVLVWLLIWWLPLLLLKQFAVADILVDIGRFFSTLAVVTFGGA